jgi:pimeloyl-ACP methyl ester carboxylesterase
MAQRAAAAVILCAMTSKPHHAFLEANGVRFHHAEQGQGPLVILLHGFPECWYSWRAQLPALAAAGFRAVAPDMRGYNLTDKPAGGYNIEQLTDDVAAIAAALGDEHAHVVGHDWGGIVAWQLAWRRPEFVRSLVVMNAPHPAAFVRYLRGNVRQMLKSSYMFLFQIPGLPERILTRKGAAAVAAAFRRNACRPGVFSPDDLDVYRDAMLRPGAARCTLAYYRQAIRQGPRAWPKSPVVVPTLVLWGEDDPVLQAGVNDRLGDWVNDLTFRPIADCGHWTQQEQPEAVNRELVAWLRSHGEG